jgi:hypothetical protein
MKSSTFSMSYATSPARLIVACCALPLLIACDAGINDESSSGGVDSQAISKGRAQQATISRAGDVA